MEAIATLVQHDPWLKMPKEERIANRQRRRAAFRQEGFDPDVPIICLSASVRSASAFLALEYVKAAPIYDFAEPTSMLWCHDLILAAQGIPSKVRSPIEMVKNIQVVCAEEFGITRAVLLSHHRHKNLVRPRQIAIYLTRTLTLMTFPQMGRRFGRDHSTCIFSFNKIAAQIEADPEFAAYMKTLSQKVQA